MAMQPFQMQPRAVSFGQPAAQPEQPYVGNVPPEFMPQVQASKQAQEEERRAYEEQIARLRAMPGQQIERMFAARAPQEAAVTALGQRAATLEGGAALQGVQQARERAQAQAMQSPQAILGGQIGTAAASQFGALEQEAAARQAAYLRGLGALGQGLASEAEQMRLTEQELLRDMQTRFLAAQRAAGGLQERSAASRQAQFGTAGTVAGTILGAALGGPAGAGIGGKLGGAAGGGMG